MIKMIFLIWLKMATSVYINGVYYPILGQNVSSDPKQHVLKSSQGSPSLMGTQSTLLTYVSEKANGKFITEGYGVHKRSVSCYTFSNYPKQKIPKKNRKCPHEGVEGVLGLLK